MDALERLTKQEHGLLRNEMCERLLSPKRLDLNMMDGPTKIIKSVAE